MAGAGLIVFGGLPGVGKTTVARQVSRELRAAYLRIDRIEQALADSGELPARPMAAGYLVGYELAGDQLGIGLSVVADCVNPLKITRDAWRAVGNRHGRWTLEVELVCSRPDEHRTRVQTRTVDIAGLTPPPWDRVVRHEYEEWDRDHLVIDTAVTSAQASAALVVRQARALADSASTS
ncbi:AAA family ATPase [Amycolatopsis benzoatilytica]|uniref:AAA family ATPase n=1 Tax=Amycolatopsis benzoatilytica TaxID=346045 RepID=UPI00037DDA58|nr:AAA family ATPase [Amycolatopsis benzoatilytica]